MILTVPPEATVDAAKDIKAFKEGKEILGLEKFEQFDVSEMKGLTLSDEELQALADCRVKHCDSKMPAGWIEKLSRENDSSKRLQLLRILLTDYASDYSVRGNKAILDYENTKHTVFAQKEFESLLDQSPYIKALAPDFL